MRKSLSKNEILSAQELKNVFKKGKKLKSRGLGLCYIINSQQSSRFGVSVSKKYGTAVQRNYAKRVVREVYRLYKDKLQICCDIVFVVYPHPLIFTSARDTIVSLLEKICVIERAGR